MGYRGLETGSRKFASHAVKQNKIIFVFESAYEPDQEEMSNHLSRHGDGVRDVAFTVEDIDVIVRVAKERGAKIVRDIWEERDEHGVVRMATVQTVRRSFLYRSSLPTICLPIDHFVTQRSFSPCSSARLCTLSSTELATPKIVSCPAMSMPSRIPYRDSCKFPS